MHHLRHKGFIAALAAVAFRAGVEALAQAEKAVDAVSAGTGLLADRQVFPAGFARFILLGRVGAADGRKAALRLQGSAVGIVEVKTEAKKGQIHAQGVEHGSIHESILFSKPMRKQRPIKASSKAHRRIRGKDGRMVMAFSLTARPGQVPTQSCRECRGHLKRPFLALIAV